MEDSEPLDPRVEAFFLEVWEILDYEEFNWISDTVRERLALTIMERFLRTLG